MIKVKKESTYYLKGKYHHTSDTETRIFYNMDDAKKYFETIDPKYYINKKDISTIETISLIYFTEFGAQCFYKKIDPNTETIDTNYKKS